MRLKKTAKTAFIIAGVAIVVLSGFAISLKQPIKKVDKDIMELPSPTEDANESATPEPTSTPIPTIDPENDPRFTSTDSLLVFANKKHRLPNGYVPSDLVTLGTGAINNNIEMKEVAAEAMENMLSDAYEEGVYPVVVSAYRSEEYQKTLWNGYVERDGKEKADTYSSRPGYSDHQTGLTADISCNENGYHLNTEFEDTEEGKWLAENAHKYGFVMRYPKGKDEITGYTYEPWHFRYIGIEEATALYNSDPNMTMEEFYGVSGGDYEE